MVSVEQKLTEEQKAEESLLLKIKDYLIKTYPDSCIAENDLSGDFYELVYWVAHYFINEHLGICGCGCMDSTVEAIVDYLNIVMIRFNKKEGGLPVSHDLCQEKFGVTDICNNPLLQFMAYILDDKGLTDHGTGIGSCWITELGQMAWFAMRTYLRYSEECERFP